jgi:heterodisulfide reductase subunit B
LPDVPLNLDAYQDGMNKFFKTNYHIPVLYFTQLMGLAFGMSAAELGIGKKPSMLELHWGRSELRFRGRRQP